MIWVNIDKPLRKCTIHTNSNCGFLGRRRVTPYKGVGSIKRDGGWLKFDGIVLAKKYCKRNFKKFKLIEHC